MDAITILGDVSAVGSLYARGGRKWSPDGASLLDGGASRDAIGLYVYSEIARCTTSGKGYRRYCDLPADLWHDVMCILRQSEYVALTGIR